METVAIYFDEIFALIVDDLLTSEVKILNAIERKKQQDREAEEAENQPEEEIVFKVSINY